MNDRLVIDRFMQDGRIVLMPSKTAKRRLVLVEVAKRFELGRTYDEPEVNDVLGQVYPDYAALRRYLVDEGLMQRDGGVYTRPGPS